MRTQCYWSELFFAALGAALGTERAAAIEIVERPTPGSVGWYRIGIDGQTRDIWQGANGFARSPTESTLPLADAVALVTAQGELSHGQQIAREEAIQRAVSEGHGRAFIERAIAGLPVLVEGSGDVLVFSLYGQSLALRRLDGVYSVMGISMETIPGTADGGDQVRERLARLA